MEKFSITTPIYYVNDRPHIGTAYTTIVCDCIARFKRLSGNNVFFLTGLDENSVKTVQAAKANGFSSVKEYADMMAEEWKSIWRELGISNDDFIRTTEERHKRNVYELFKRVYEKGDIYKGKYEGFYCEGCESFIKELDLIEGKCPLHKKEPKKLVEENYFFRLSKYQNALLEHYEAHPEFILPEGKRNEVISFVESGLEDISITRPDIGWGIKAPIDDSQIIWVWFDALVNYLVNKEFWPTTVHMMAKDIIRFHAVIWPAMLLSAGYPLPKTIFAHGFLTMNGQKISKSLGNAIDPRALSKKYSLDALRYFLLSEVPLGDDGDFNEASLVNRINNELVANYGNLFYRVTSFTQKNFDSRVPEGTLGEEEKELKKKLSETKAFFEKNFNEFKIHEAIKQVFSLSSIANKYFQDRKPWEQFKKNRQDCSTTIFTSLNLIKGISILLLPIIPSAAQKALSCLKTKADWNTLEEFSLKPGQSIKCEMLFKKIN